MTPRALRAALLIALGLSAGCAATSPRLDVSDPSIQARMAVMALLREDFEAARPRLLHLASQCESGEHGRRAVLLLAAAELDTQNEAGSPATAAQLARSYLLLPDAPIQETVLARALYRLAADQGGLDSPGRGPTVAPRFDECGASPELEFRPLPETPAETGADRMRTLEARVAAQSDSLATMTALSDSLAMVRTAAEASRQRVTELEQELHRITQLLTSGAERHSGSDRE